jgi:hypothetical protein
MFYTFVILTVLIKLSDLCDKKWQVTSSENKPRIKCTSSTEKNNVIDKKIHCMGRMTKLNMYGRILINTKKEIAFLTLQSRRGANSRPHSCYALHIT